MTPAERGALLVLARAAIAARLQGRSLPEAPTDTPALSRPAGAFVSLHEAGELRGCIGMVEAVRGLAETVAQCAAAAATEDPRFPPLPLEALDRVRIEISILQPPFNVHALSEVRIGQHGLLISRGHRRGLLLPQVATERGWDAERFVRETCAKAGLPHDAWERGARLQAFEALVFSED
jgi:uncharacterized protein